MKNETILAMDRNKTKILVQAVVLIGVATAASLFRQQMVTGTIVNAVLFIAVSLTGARIGILVGAVPSIVALSTGVLPPILAPMVPFIIIGNAILISVFSLLKNGNYWLAVGLSAVLKFLFLFAIGSIITGIFIEKGLAVNISAMMGYTQLLTAFAGGILAWVFLRRNHG